MEQTADNREIFEYMPVPRALMTLALPTIAGQLIILIYSLADTFFIGRTGNPRMVAAASLILPVFNICIPIANLFSVGGGTLISRLLGAGQEKEARKTAMFSLWGAAASALLYSLFMFLFMGPLLHALGASDAVLPYAKQYAGCVLVIGALPTILSMAMAGLLRSVGCAKQAGFGVSMGGLLNIALDPLFMFVLLPKGMETMGAGLATMLSNLAASVYFFLVIRSLKGKTVITYDPRAGLPVREHILKIFSVGIPASVATLLFDIDYMVIGRLMTSYGDIPMAAVGIVLKAERLPLNIGIGLCQGMVPIAAYNYANKNYHRMRDTLNFTRLAGLAAAAVSVTLYLVFAPQIMRVFINDPETIRTGTVFLRFRCAATPLMFLCFHLVHFFQAVGEGRTSLFLAVVRWAVFNIPMLFLLNALLGMRGIVLSQMTADICTVIVSFIVYRHFEKRIFRTRTGEI